MDYINLESKDYKNIILNNLKKDKKSNNKEMKEVKIYPKIVKIKFIDNGALRMFLNTNQWYDIKYFIDNKEISSNDLVFHTFKYNSSLKTASY